MRFETGCLRFEVGAMNPRMFFHLLPFQAHNVCSTLDLQGFFDSFSRHSRPLRLQMLPEKVFSGFEGSSDICVFLSLASPQCEKARFTTLSPCPTLALLVVLPSLARSACEVDRSAQHANPSCKAVCNGTAERAARTRRDTSKNGPTFSVHTQQGHFGEAGRGGLWES